MQEIKEEIGALILKHKKETNLPLNLHEEAFTSALIEIVNRERREVSDFVVKKLAVRVGHLGTFGA